MNSAPATTTIEYSQLAAFAQQLPHGARSSWLQGLQEAHSTFASHPTASALIVAHPCPTHHVAALLGALAARKSAICAHPEWSPGQWQDLCSFATPLETHSRCIAASLPASETTATYLYLPTGGTGGKLKLARHTPQTLRAATAGLQQFLQQEALPTYTLLPPYHTGGLMPWLRAFFTDSALIPSSLEQLLATQALLSTATVSLVPTQLYRILQSAQASRLTALRAILVGGAPTGKELLDKARKLRLPLVPCYGSTETAGLVAAIPVQAFLDATMAATVLPHARIQLSPSGEILVQSTSLFYDYHTQSPVKQTLWHSGDRGHIDADGHLRVRGRIQPLINTGGKKVDPALVTDAIRTHLPAASDVIVFGLPDPEWGQCVAVLLCGYDCDLAQLRALLRPHLPPEALPRRLRCMPFLPSDEKGKLTPERLRLLFHEHPSST